MAVFSRRDRFVGSLDCMVVVRLRRVSYHLAVRLVTLVAWFVLGVGAAGCAPPACSDREDQRLARDVELVATSDGRPGRDAAERLARAGRRAVPILETGLYGAEPDGRRRIVRALVATGSPEVRPILEHLSRHDSDEGVREAARAGLASLR
jgi:hypothetical protein